LRNLGYRSKDAIKEGVKEYCRFDISKKMKIYKNGDKYKVNPNIT